MKPPSPRRAVTSSRPRPSIVQCAPSSEMRIATAPVTGATSTSAPPISTRRRGDRCRAVTTRRCASPCALRDQLLAADVHDIARGAGDHDVAARHRSRRRRPRRRAGRRRSSATRALPARVELGGERVGERQLLVDRVRAARRAGRRPARTCPRSRCGRRATATPCTASAPGPPTRTSQATSPSAVMRATKPSVSPALATTASPARSVPWNEPPTMTPPSARRPRAPVITLQPVESIASLPARRAGRRIERDDDARPDRRAACDATMPSRDRADVPAMRDRATSGRPRARACRGAARARATCARRGARRRRSPLRGDRRRAAQRGAPSPATPRSGPPTSIVTRRGRRRGSRGCAGSDSPRAKHKHEADASQRAAPSAIRASRRGRASARGRRADPACR